jgi:hypothetical protein
MLFVPRCADCRIPEVQAFGSWPQPHPLFRKDGLAQQVLSALAKVKAGRDAALALAAACALLALAAEDAHPAYMASTAAVVLAEQLLQVGGWYWGASAVRI